MRVDIMDFSDQWRFLGREAELAAEQAACGITYLGKANHAQTGYYNQAFFALSIGIERIAKLAILADYAIENNGSFPSNDTLRKISHDIDKLLNYCDILSAKYRHGKKFAERPNSEIHAGIIKTLNEFAKQSRYYNLNYITGEISPKAPEPISVWWQRVGQPILKKHYNEKKHKRDIEQAKLMNELLRDHVMVMHHDENGNNIDNMETFITHGAGTKIVQKYGQFYTLQIIRWLAFLIDDLSHIGAYKKRIEPLLGLNERFVIFMNEDSLFKGRKTWSIYKP
jgi:hypothetical protein